LTDLKIILFGNLPLDLNKIKGGVESVCLNLLDGFAPFKEVEICFISFEKDIKQISILQYSTNCTIHYLPYKYPKYEILDYILNRKVLKKLIQRIQPDIIHIQGAAPSLLRFFNYSKHNIVVTQHGIMSEEIKYNKGLKKKAKFFFKVLVEKYYFPTFQNLVFISRYNFSLFPATHKHQYAFINNPVNGIFFNNESILGNSHQLIYIGWISRLKNVLLILNALNLLKNKNINYSLNIVGEFKEDLYKQQVIKFINEHELNGQVIFKGQLTQEQVKTELDNSSIFILPSLQENLPVSIAEAMARSKIVIASDVGAISEMFEDGISGFLIPPNDYNKLADKLEFLYFNKEIAIEVAKKAHVNASEKYKPELIAKKTLDFYSHVLINNAAKA
jgi:glycosyltransferase involved in cell wall biosynthesis